MQMMQFDAVSGWWFDSTHLKKYDSQFWIISQIGMKTKEKLLKPPPACSVLFKLEKVSYHLQLVQVAESLKKSLKN